MFYVEMKGYITSSFAFANRLLFVAVIVFLGSKARSEAMQDGINILLPTEKQTNITLAGGFNAELGPWLKPDQYKMVIRSISNWNDSYQVEFSPNVPLRKSGEYPPNPGIFVDGHLVVDLEAGRLKVIDEETAKRISIICHARLILRKSFDYRLAIRFTTEKSEYRHGNPIIVSVLIKNVGVKPVFLEPESLTGPERSTLVEIFPLQGFGVNRPTDVRDQNSRTSFAGSPVEVKPGGTLELRQEDLGKWFECKNDGRYSFLGTYELNFFDSVKATKPCWAEWLGDEFTVVVHE